MPLGVHLIKIQEVLVVVQYGMQMVISIARHRHTFTTKQHQIQHLFRE